MDLNTMKTNLSELRTELIGKKAVYEQQKAAAQRTIAELQNSINSIKEEDIEFLTKHGFNASMLKVIDVPRLSSDEEYLATTKANLEDLCENIYKSLMEEVS